jgi:uncharacterized membrane protein YfcA
MEYYLLLAVVGLIGGFLAGWVGLGGGIILAPLLLYVPQVLGLYPFEVKEVARLTIVQSLFSTVAAGFVHWRASQFHRPLVMWTGAAIAIASLAGAIVSELRIASPELLLGILATLALAASVMMFRCPPEAQAKDDSQPVYKFTFNRGRATAIGLGVGFLGGMVGQSGAFLTIPLLIHVLRIPTRLAIGSSLGITFCAALAGSIGKFTGGGHVAWQQIAALVAGSVLGSQLGSSWSHRVRATTLKNVLALLIAASAARMWYQVLS